MMFWKFHPNGKLLEDGQCSRKSSTHDKMKDVEIVKEES